MGAGPVELENVQKMGGKVGNGVVLVGLQQNPTSGQALKFLGVAQNAVVSEYQSDSLALLHRPCTCVSMLGLIRDRARNVRQTGEFIIYAAADAEVLPYS